MNPSTYFFGGRASCRNIDSWYIMAIGTWTGTFQRFSIARASSCHPFFSLNMSQRFSGLLGGADAQPVSIKVNAAARPRPAFLIMAGRFESVEIELFESNFGRGNNT
jgi:hypothetical protein